MNYIGSKLKLSQHFIPKTIETVCGKDLTQKIFCDIFAGTGIVGRTFKSKVYEVISNDMEYYSFVINRNYIGNHLSIKNKDNFINALNKLPITDNGFIFNNYCLGGTEGRQYFSDYNGKRIDTIRKKIEEWRKLKILNNDLYFFLLCSLLECADEVANTASVYGAYLKHLKKTAQQPLILRGAEYELSKNEHKVYNEDANILIRKISGDILYLDPPYNSRQYGANYHLLNTIAEYKAFSPRGKTGLREYNRSKYCSYTTAREQLEDLIANAQFQYIFLSYNNEGLMNTTDIKTIMSKYGHYDLVQTQYQRFKADTKRVNKAFSTVEYLHVLEKI